MLIKRERKNASLKEYRRKSSWAKEKPLLAVESVKTDRDPIVTVERVRSLNSPSKPIFSLD